MTLEELHAEELAREWTTRVVDRMKASGIAEEEIEETAFIIYQLIQVAVNALKNEPVVKLPKVKQELVLDKEKAFLVLDLFIRGISHMARILRDVDQPAPISWDQRKQILEKLAWETFILSRVLVGSYYLPVSANNLLKTEGDLRVVMNQSGVEILKRHLPKGTVLKKSSIANAEPMQISAHDLVMRKAASLVRPTVSSDFEEEDDYES